jgi:hypothetical protein
MDIGFSPTTTVTLRATSNGSASIYFSNGAGVIGGDAHERVRQAATTLVAVANRLRVHLTPAEGSPLPATGEVAFYAVTDSGLLAGGMTMNSPVPHPLSPLFRAGDDLMTELRLVGQARGLGVPPEGDNSRKGPGADSRP